MLTQCNHMHTRWCIACKHQADQTDTLLLCEYVCCSRIRMCVGAQVRDGHANVYPPACGYTRTHVCMYVCTLCTSVWVHTYVLMYVLSMWYHTNVCSSVWVIMYVQVCVYAFTYVQCVGTTCVFKCVGAFKHMVMVHMCIRWRSCCLQV